MNALDGKAFSTRAVHAGERVPPGEFRPVATPIHSTVGYLYDSMETVDQVFAGTHPGYVYPRYGSATVTAFEAAVASLEGAEAAHAFASGMAALHAALLATGISAGSHTVAALDLYGATFTLLNSLLIRLGVESRFVEVSDLAAVEAALDVSRPVVLLVETVSNPLLKVADVPALSEIAHRFGAQLLVDNTFASPYLFNPLAHGADLVVHSATKYLSGHGDVMAGVVCCSPAFRQQLYEINKLVGATLGPFEAWLALRGLKTLPLRFRQQCENAARLAAWLSGHPRIARVYYPGLPDHPQHGLATRLFAGKGYGGVLSFEIKDADQAAAFRFMDALQLCVPATTLGDIYSEVLHPATASHRSLSPAERARIGITDGLVRLSAGIEACQDIQADLDQTLENVS